MAIFSGAVGLGALSVGLDIGSKRARVVGLARGGSGELLLQHASIVEFSDPASAVAGIKSVLRGIAARAPGVRCNLGPASVIVQQVEFPDMADEDLLAAARIEAEQLIPDIQSMALDTQVIGRKTRGDDHAHVASIMIVAAPKQAVNDRMALLREANVQIDAVLPDGVALANAVLALQPSEAGAVLAIDIGMEATGLVAVFPEKDAMVPIVRYIPTGTSVLVGAAGGEKPSSTDERDRESKRERWLREVERSIEFVSGKLNAPAQKILVVGDGARSSDTMSWLGQSVQIPVSAWNPLKDVRRGPGAPEDRFIQQWGSDCAVAVGLALGEGD